MSQVRREDIRRWSLDGLRYVAVGAAYYGAARAGFTKQLTVDSAIITPFRPTVGVALSAMLILGIRIWPGIALGAVATVGTLGPLGWYGLLITLGNIIAALCMCLVLRRAGFHLDLDRLRDGLVLVVAGLVATTLTAAISTATQLLTDRIELSGFLAVWTVWWSGDALGVLVVTPVLLLLRRLRVPRTRLARCVECVLLSGTSIVVAGLVTLTQVDLLFLVFPLLAFLALRFQLAGTAPCALVFSVLATVAAVDAHGPFHNLTLPQRMLMLQAFNGATALTALLIAALVTEQLSVQRRIEGVLRDLAEVVDRLSPGATTARWPLRNWYRRSGD